MKCIACSGRIYAGSASGTTVPGGAATFAAAHHSLSACLQKCLEAYGITTLDGGGYLLHVPPEDTGKLRRVDPAIRRRNGGNLFLLLISELQVYV